MKLGDMPFQLRLVVFPFLLLGMEILMAFVVVYWLATDRPIKVQITDKEAPDVDRPGPADIIGRWPGDESDEEVNEALEELS